MKGSIDVHNYLQTEGIPHELSQVKDKIDSAETAAALLGLKPEQVAKTLVFIGDKEPLLVIIASNRMVDNRRLKEVCEVEELRMATPEEVVECTGYLAGCTPPVALMKDARVFIDYSAMSEDVIYVGSGDMHTILKIRSYDLIRASDGEPVGIAKEDF